MENVRVQEGGLPIPEYREIRQHHAWRSRRRPLPERRQGRVMLPASPSTATPGKVLPYQYEDSGIGSPGWDVRVEILMSHHYHGLQFDILSRRRRGPTSWRC